MTDIKPCPWCGCQPKIVLGKTYYCQLHGEPSQRIVIKCDWKDCAAKPSIEAGDIYNGIGDAIYKKEATEEAIKIWNTRHQPPESNNLVPLEEDHLRHVIRTTICMGYYETRPLEKVEQLIQAICSKFGTPAIPSVSLVDIKDAVHLVLCQLLVDDSPDKLGVRKSDTIGGRINLLLTRGK